MNDEQIDRHLLESAFPGLAGTPWAISSPTTDRYNCIAWVMGDSTRWWWPTLGRGYWPADLARDTAVATFVQLLARGGFTAAEPATSEGSAERIALFGIDGRVTHASRELARGEWTSKLGSDVDITHPLRALEGDIYGTVVLMMGRRA